MLLGQLMAFWVLATPEESNGNLTIYGKITDENLVPLAGATVIVENLLLGTSTNPDGTFSFSRLKPGTYKIIVTFLGYEKQTVEITLKENVTIDIVLKSSSIMGEEIIVSSTRASSRMPIAQTSLKKDDLKKFNNGFDIPYVLELIPSVVATSEGGTGVGNTAFRIRGTDMSRINVTVNNIPLNDPESQAVFWVNMPDFTSSVDNVQVQRGVGTSTNGAASFGATVNFQTTTLTPIPFAGAEFLFGSFNTWRTTAKVSTGLISNRFSFEGRFSKLNSDGYIDRATSDHQSMFLTAAWHTEKSILRFNIIHGEEHTGITWEGTPGYMLAINRRYNPAGEYVDNDGNTKYYDDEKDNYTQTHYHLIYSNQLNKNISINIASFWTIGKGYYEEYKENRKFSDYGLSPVILGGTTYQRTDLIRQKWLDNDFYGTMISANFRRGRIEGTFGGGWNRYDGYHFGKIIWTEINAGIPKNFEWYRNAGVKTDYSLFTKASLLVLQNLNLFGDIQYRAIDYHLTGPDDDLANLDQSHIWKFINPKLGFNYKISSFHDLFFSFGVGNREPSRADLKDAMKYGSDNTPLSERLYDYELGYSLKLNSYAFGVNLYYMNYKDQLVLTGKLSDVGYPLMSNVDKSYRTGVEITTTLKPAKWVTWAVSATISRNKIVDFVEYIDQYDNSNDWNPLPQVVNHLGNTPISFSPSLIGSGNLNINIIKGLDLSLVSKFVGKQYFDNTGSKDRRLDSYFVNNLKVDYKINIKGLKSTYVEFYINNIFDKMYLANAWVYRARFANDGSEYREDGFFPQAGRNFMLKIGCEF